MYFGISELNVIKQIFIFILFWWDIQWESEDAVLEYLLIFYLLCVKHLYFKEVFVPIPSVWQIQQLIRC